jgi:Rrf2 family protein
MYGKQTERAIAAMSRLAEVWDGGRTRLSSIDIAENRSLPKPMVAKLLTTLSQGGLVTGSPGPGGGYALARPPAEITFRQVYELFERDDTSHVCPFGGGVCGAANPCAMHDRLLQVQSNVARFLNETSFEQFRVFAQEKGYKPTKVDANPDGTRETWRARLTRKPG